MYTTISISLFIYAILHTLELYGYISIKFLFKWYDLWVGLFYDKHKAWLYILPFPTIGIILKLPQRRYWLFDKKGNHVTGDSVTKETMEYYIMHNYAYDFIPYLAKNGSTVPIVYRDLTKYKLPK